jgi:acyl carrier protein
VTAAPAPDRLLQQVLRAVQQIRPEHAAPQPGDTFTALGLDSLDRLALAVAVEQATGLAICDQALADAAGPGDLTRSLLPPEGPLP